MKGEFNYRLNATGEGVFAVMWILAGLVLPAVLWTYGYEVGAIYLFLLGAAILIPFCPMLFLGVYDADDDGVTIRTPFRRYRFSYKDIKSVKTEHRDGGHSRIGDTMSIITELTLATEGRTYCFNSYCHFSTNEQLKDIDGFKKELDEIEMVKLGRFIEERINMSRESVGYEMSVLQ